MIIAVKLNSVALTQSISKVPAIDSFHLHPKYGIDRFGALFKNKSTTN